MVIGIIAVILGFIPMCGYFAIVPAIVGLVLGIVAVSQSKKTGKPKGMALAGVICNGVALLVIALWTLLFAASVAQTDQQLRAMQSEQRLMQRY